MKNSILIFFLFLSFSAVQSQESAEDFSAVLAEQPMTLEECITNAMANNSNLKSVKLGEQALEYQIKEIKSGGLPQVTAMGQLTNNFALA